MPAVLSRRRCAAYLPFALLGAVVLGGVGVAPAGAATATSCRSTNTVILGPGESMTFTGQVTTSAGTGIPGVTISLDRWSSGAYRSYLHLVSDSAGRAYFRLTPATAMALRVRWSGSSSWAACAAPGSVVWLSNDSRVLAAMAAHKGAPYLWGGAGPTAFDCSGLMLYVFAHFGRALPHNSQLQYNAVHHISTSSLQPGDMVFFGTSTSGIYHVGMYAGSGSIWHAPGDGQTVQLDKIWTTAYYAGRV